MKSRLLRLSWVGAVATLLISGAGCSLFSPEDYDSSYFFIAEVTNIDAPESFSYGDPLSIQIGGYLGPNLCYKLDWIDKVRSPNRLDITVQGVYDSGGHGYCFTAVSGFDQTIVIPPPKLSPEFTIVVHQPDGSTLEHTVTVKESQD